MKEMEQITVIRIISEPGDMTRYDYIVHSDGPDRFCFAPCNNTFRYPQRLSYWDVKDIDATKIDKAMVDRAKEEYCNPYTMAECIRTVQELWTGCHDEH